MTPQAVHDRIADLTSIADVEQALGAPLSVVDEAAFRAAHPDLTRRLRQADVPDAAVVRQATWRLPSHQPVTLVVASEMRSGPLRLVIAPINDRPDDDDELQPPAPVPIDDEHFDDGA